MTDWTMPVILEGLDGGDRLMTPAERAAGHDGSKASTGRPAKP